MKIPEKQEDITLAWFNDIFRPHGITVYSFKFTGETGNGLGFMGSLEQVELEVSRCLPNNLNVATNYAIGDAVDDNDNQEQAPTETLHVVLKTLPKDPFRRSYAANDGFSSREVSMYTKIFGTWNKFLDSRQVPLSDRFRYPVCYYGAEEGEDDTYKYILVLENLTTSKSPFYLWPGGFMEPLPWSAASLVVRQIARFHATGIAYKIENNVECYYKLFPKLNHVVSPVFHLMWNQGFEVTKKLIEETVSKKDIPDGLFEQLDNLRGDENRDLLIKWFTTSSMFSGNKATVCHHDLHSNNLALSKDQTLAVLFDYQASCVFNPMKDLSFFLILNCTVEDATENLSNALQVYHDEFAKTMTALKTDFEYSLESLTKDYDWFIAFSITHIMTGAPVWITGAGSTFESKRRFTTHVIESYKRGVLKFPTHEWDA